MSSSYAPCAACKYLRRKCTQECVFAPYFPPDNPQKFINVHKVFGASNVGKILNELSPGQRNDAVNSLAYEAECRIKDPIYGCVGYVSYLQHHLRQVQQEIEQARKELATYIGPAAMQPILTNPANVLHHHHLHQQPPHSFSFDLSTYQSAAYPGPVLIQEPQAQMAAVAAAAREQEMLRSYAQQQQQEQLYAQQLQQQQELYAQQQQRMFLQQQQQQMQQNDLVRINDAGDLDTGGFENIPDAVAGVHPELVLGGSFDTHSFQYHQVQQLQQQEQEVQVHELLMQQQQIIMPHQFGQPRASHSQRDGSEEERSFGPL